MCVLYSSNTLNFISYPEGNQEVFQNPKSLNTKNLSFRFYMFYSSLILYECVLGVFLHWFGADLSGQP